MHRISTERARRKDGGEALAAVPSPWDPPGLHGSGQAT